MTERGVIEPSIVVREVEKGFGSGRWRTPILHGISMEVDRGEVVFLVGPSGSGKTTLLSLLGCLLTPDRGSIRVLGREVSEESPASLEAFRLKHLGFVFQTFNLFPTLSALDNVRLALCMRGVPLKRAKERAAELLVQVGLEHRLWLRPTRLSTGECQRVAVARALANEPSILLADEPTAALDAENGQAVMRLLMRLTEERGVTLVIVTHDNRILHYADRILRLEDGYLTQVQEVSIATADADALSLASSRIAMETAEVPDDAPSAQPKVLESLTSSAESEFRGSLTRLPRSAGSRSSTQARWRKDIEFVMEDRPSRFEFERGLRFPRRPGLKETRRLARVDVQHTPASSPARITVESGAPPCDSTSAHFARGFPRDHHLPQAQTRSRPSQYIVVAKE